MVELVYVGAPGMSHADPPLGQLEPGQHVHVEDDVARRLLAGAHFAVAESAEDAPPAPSVRKTRTT